MMRTVRRRDLAPRVEIMPLIDVVFLLLTFFVYSLMVMVHAEVLPVRLTPLATGGQATPGRVEAITIDHEGRLFLNREPVSDRQLSDHLEAVSRQAEPPLLYLALEAKGSTDRGPVLINLIERIRQVGIEDFVIVGQPNP